jgi:hypothetical protein
MGHFNNSHFLYLFLILLKIILNLILIQTLTFVPYFSIVFFFKNITFLLLLFTLFLRCMALNLAVNTVISADAKGVIEYWDVDTFQMPKKPKISFDYKTETGTYLHVRVIKKTTDDGYTDTHIHSLMYSLTQSLTHSLNHSLTHSLTHSLNHSHTNLLADVINDNVSVIDHRLHTSHLLL